MLWVREACHQREKWAHITESTLRAGALCLRMIRLSSFCRKTAFPAHEIWIFRSGSWLALQFFLIIFRVTRIHFLPRTHPDRSLAMAWLKACPGDEKIVFKTPLFLLPEIILLYYWVNYVTVWAQIMNFVVKCEKVSVLLLLGLQHFSLCTFPDWSFTIFHNI